MSSRPTYAYQGEPNADIGLKLMANAPNPFIEMTLVRFDLPATTDVTLRIYNSQGQEICTKAGSFDAGENHIILRRSDLQEPGLYSYQLETVYGIASRKLMMY
ncbi:MAG: T9SS type A sorting domain-containing protein [Bacteroidetes bacterium]|nr:MAG: T9SS type A sorting domain-containing protein [Bacteroidota bacterium]